MEAAGALGAAASILGSISNPLGMQVGPVLDVVVIRTPFQTYSNLLGSMHRWY